LLKGRNIYFRIGEKVEGSIDVTGRRGRWRK